MLAKLSKFRGDKNGAIAMMFAICLLPMVLLIALAVDFSFFTEARSQVQLASDAAATHAVRAATGTYALETADGIPTAVATADAIAAGEQAGSNWFAAQLGILPTASVPLSAGNPNVQVTNTTNPSGFSAAVTYTGYYPPFFDHLFSSNANWNIAGSSGAASQYSYVEIMMMLDTSQSMDIGAGTSDILTMEENSVCVPKSYYPTVINYNWMGSNYDPGYGGLYTPFPLAANGTYTNLNMATGAQIANYTGSSSTDTNGMCLTPTANPVTSPFTNVKETNGWPAAPCALACHTTTTTFLGLPADLYGMARRNNVTLRIDDVFAAAENVVSSMIDTEQASQQFAVGIYQFNDDISGDKDADGQTIGQIAPGDGTAGNYEATYSLTTALSNLRAIDYKVTPTETSFPPLANVNGNDDNDYTNFPQAVTDFVKGDATNGVALKAVTTSTQGLSITNPVKDIFIVTDGLEDTSQASSVGRHMGEMTSVASETGQTASAICQKFKNLNYTVYVLYITYDSLPLKFYTAQTYDTATTATQVDYPGAIANSEINQEYVEGMSSFQSGLGTTTPAPDLAALQACASTTNGQSDLYIATSDDQINTQLSAMLKSALSGAIRITN